ncbi:hypothetical protein B0T24DRAFT_660893 [Lasiosphaeria ovina]|uniref:PNPLA domain-containing protein n=1 Tax=Lasiosphaeria ovina TaxID=92902 RepID=A0AAE0NIF8_9PEZI|nr:hypothetical protein B0T24DRAFT_660893 [Lasiosphaeria ovina]
MDDKPLCLLALDGGGIRGLSQLVILDEIMNRIKYDLDVDEDLLPADFFDLIGGTSTGGLIALLLGRLRRSVPQARKEYVRIAEEVFSLPRYLKKNTFEGRKLEEAVKRLLGKDRSEEKMLEKGGSCKVFVCAVPQQDVKARAGPRLFRTYKVRENASFNCTIWEACRATSAAPSYFEPIKIGDDGEQETFVDGALGYNNPIELVLEEARCIFPGRKVACIVSIGTGVATVINFSDSPKTSPVKLINALKKMATESDTTAEKTHRRFRNVQDTCFRFTVDRGLPGIGLEEWKELSHVNKVVRALLASNIVGQEGSNRLIRLSAVSSDEPGAPQGLPRTLDWRPKEGSIPSFYYVTEQLASHIVGFLSQRHWIVPFGRNDDFVGRGEELEQLLATIPPESNKDNCQLVALEGLGGIGKTQIALEAIFRVRDAHPECSIFWVPAIDSTTFENAYRKIGQELKIAGIGEDKADIKTLVKTALNSEDSGSWLLVVDNADDTDLLFGDTSLADHLPSSQKGSILFTTRNHEVVRRLSIRQANRICVTTMSRDEAVDLLKKHLRPEQMSDNKSATDLLDLLADLPLAIKQASAYMDQTGITTMRYLEHCRSSDADLIKILGKDFEDKGRYKSTQNPVATTWLVSFHHISRDNHLSAQYMKFMSFLSEKDIPRDLLPPGDGELEMDEAIGLLKAYAFISERAGQKLEGDSTDDAAKSNLLYNLATAVWSLGNYKQAEQLYRRTLALRTKVVGAQHPDTLRSMHGLANAAWSQGKHKEAEQLYRQTLAQWTEVLGARHCHTLLTMNNLANAVRDQGNYKEAAQLYRQTLTLRTEVLGVQHPITLRSMHGLANAVRDEGNYKEAEQLYRQTLALRTEVLGLQHPDTLRSVHGLANVVWDQGNYHEARQLYQQTLALRTEVLGLQHPDTLRSMHGVASVVGWQGNYKAAEKLHRQTLALLYMDLRTRCVIRATTRRLSSYTGKHSHYTQKSWARGIPTHSGLIGNMDKALLLYQRSA